MVDVEDVARHFAEIGITDQEASGTYEYTLAWLTTTGWENTDMAVVANSIADRIHHVDSNPQDLPAFTGDWWKAPEGAVCYLVPPNKRKRGSSPSWRGRGTMRGRIAPTQPVATQPPVRALAVVMEEQETAIDRHLLIFRHQLRVSRLWCHPMQVRL
jgi:hypothetical protein